MGSTAARTTVTRAPGRSAAARVSARTASATAAAPAAAPARRSSRQAASPAVAAAAPARRRRSPEATRAALRARADGQRHLSFGVICIAVAGVLLAGVVAVNVLVLRQNVELDRATRERTRLRAENAGLASQVSATVSASRIEGLAQRSLGLVQAAPEATTYLDLGRRK